MSKNTTIALIFFFVLLLIGLVIYGVITMFNDKGPSVKNVNPSNSTNNPNNPTNTAPTVTTQAEMTAFVKRFRDGFEAWHDWEHCELITIANTFDTNQLNSFASIYLSTYGITVVEQMDNAIIWCLYPRDIGQTLYNKLKAL